jgi:hypothetical protein
MALLSLLQMPCELTHHRHCRHRISPLTNVARSCCIGIKGGKIHTLSPLFSSDEIEGAQIVDAE